MKQLSDEFIYFTKTTECPESDTATRVAVVRKGLSSTAELFDELFEKIRLPGYFGFNWNALSDCLRDLSWIKERHVVLVHEDVPSVGNIDLKRYLEVLAESVQSWEQGDHSFSVWFPLAAKERLIEVSL